MRQGFNRLLKQGSGTIERGNPYLCSRFCPGGCGEIGRRARLRIWCRKAWGFESLHPHFPMQPKGKTDRSTTTKIYTWNYDY